MKSIKISNSIILVMGVILMAALLFGILKQPQPGEISMSNYCPLPEAFTSNPFDSISIQGVDKLIIEQNTSMEFWSSGTLDETFSAFHFSIENGVTFISSNHQLVENQPELKWRIPKLPSKIKIEDAQVTFSGFISDSSIFKICNQSVANINDCSFGEITLEASDTSFINMNNIEIKQLRIEICHSHLNIYGNKISQKLYGILLDQSGIWINAHCPEIHLKTDLTSWVNYR